MNTTQISFPDFLEEQGLIRYVKNRFGAMYHLAAIDSYETIENGYIVHTDNTTYRVIRTYDSETNKYDFVSGELVNGEFKTFEHKRKQPILTYVLGYALVVHQLKKK